MEDIIEEERGLSKEELNMDEATLLGRKVGVDQPKIVPRPCEVLNFRIKEVKKGDKVTGKVLMVNVKYPQRDRMEIGSVKYEKDGKLVESGLWINLDSDKNINSKSALAYMLKFYKAIDIPSLIGKTVDTTVDERGYLMIKAY